MGPPLLLQSVFIVTEGISPDFWSHIPIINRMWMILRHSQSLNIFYKKIYYKICNSEFYVWIMICWKLLMIHQHLNNFTLFQSITIQGSCLLHFSHQDVPKILKMKKIFLCLKIEKNHLILIITPEKQDKTLELSKH